MAMRTIIRKLVSESGAEIAEVAVVLPLVFMFLLGIVWFGRAFNIYSTITQAAQQGAVTAARPKCATCRPDGGWPGNTSFPNDATVENAVFSVLRASSLNTNEVITFSPTPLPCTLPPPLPVGGCVVTPNNVTICRDVQLNATQPVQCGTVVSFRYPFQFYFPFTSLSMQQITLTAQAQSRMEN